MSIISLMIILEEQLNRMIFNNKNKMGNIKIMIVKKKLMNLSIMTFRMQFNKIMQKNNKKKIKKFN